MLLIVHQLLRTVMAEATKTLPGLAADRASYTVALTATHWHRTQWSETPGPVSGPAKASWPD
ncbi:hypothetical protein AFL94_15710 [Arthrobacter sp. LS16]|nr:hypothetical protein AFL94_15710 [Arthrobacter sp. LS16]